MSSRLTRVNGRLLVELTSPTYGPPVYRVVGNDLECAGPGIGWLGRRTGRFNTVREPRRSNLDPVPCDVGAVAQLLGAEAARRAEHDAHAPA